MPSGPQIRQARDYLELKQKEFGRRFGLAQSEVSRIEKGDAGVPDRLTRRLLVEAGIDFPESGGVYILSNLSKGVLRNNEKEREQLRKRIPPLRIRIGRTLMKVDISDAAERLTDLVREAESGEEVILTVDGRPAVRLVPAAHPLTAEE